jgi:hypothetical protein
MRCRGSLCDPIAFMSFHILHSYSFHCAFIFLTLCIHFLSYAFHLHSFPFTFFSMSFHLPFTLHFCFYILHSFPFMFLSCCIHFLSCCVHFLSFCINFLSHFFHVACISMQHVAWSFWQHILVMLNNTFWPAILSLWHVCKCLRDSGGFCRLRARLLNSNLLELQWTLAAKSENRMLRMIFQHVILSFSPAANIYNIYISYYRRTET